MIGGATDVRVRAGLRWEDIVNLGDKDWVCIPGGVVCRLPSRIGTPLTCYVGHIHYSPRHATWWFSRSQVLDNDTVEEELGIGIPMPEGGNTKSCDCGGIVGACCLVLDHLSRLACDTE